MLLISVRFALPLNPHLPCSLPVLITTGPSKYLFVNQAFAAPDIYLNPICPGVGVFRHSIKVVLRDVLDMATATGCCFCEYPRVIAFFFTSAGIKDLSE